MPSFEITREERRILLDALDEKIQFLHECQRSCERHHQTLTAEGYTDDIEKVQALKERLRALCVSASPR